jgi:hypothetical protein
MQFKLIKSKKGASFFLFDAVIASGVFFMAVALILFSLSVKPEIETPRVYGEDLMEFYLETEVRDIKDDFISKLMIDRNITDPSNTLIEQILVFNYESEDQLNRNFTEIITGSKIPEYFGYNVSITNSNTIKEIYRKESGALEITSYITLRRIAITKLDNGKIYGPLIVTIGVWY